MKGFTLVEILVSVAILAILATITVMALAPQAQFERATGTQALTELKEFAKALDVYAIDHGAYPVNSGSVQPAEVKEYLDRVKSSWPAGPFSGSEYSYDNFMGQTCANPAANNSIQISLRNVPGRNPNGSSNWVWYYVIQGKGAPSCSNGSLQGECVNCAGFTL